MHFSARSLVTFWDDRVVGVRDVSLAVRGDRVHPRHAAPRSWRRSRSCTDVAWFIDKNVEGAQVLGVRVADRPEAVGRPAHERGSVR